MRKWIIIVGVQFLFLAGLVVVALREMHQPVQVQAAAAEVRPTAPVSVTQPASDQKGTIGWDAARTSPAAVKLRAEVQSKPPRITLKWTKDPSALWELGRRSPGEGQWQPLTRYALPGDTAEFADNGVEVGKSYEYAVLRAGSRPVGGYISSAIELPPVENRGKIVLLIHADLAKPLEKEIALLTWDLVGDGWQVLRHDVPAGLKPPQVKQLIVGDYEQNKTSLAAVYILGHVAVPYSGDASFDGHPDHKGAWPADGYYADMEGSWTDRLVTTAAKASARQKNVPGDGVFDESRFPGELKLQLGRVDLANMTGFAGNETELLRRYIVRSHAYRHATRRYPARALVADNFPEPQHRPAAYASTAWRSFPPIMGLENVRELATATSGAFIASVSQNDYLWVYACGPGKYTSCAGSVSTQDFRKMSLRCPFWIVFGSYFGDWDVPDSLLRAPLAGGEGLASFWSGYPFWFVHPMGIGQTLGYCARLSMNNGVPVPAYVANPGLCAVHMALMGDPTLRLYPVAPPGDVAAKSDGDGVAVTWAASGDQVHGYHVYRAENPGGVFERLTKEPVGELKYKDGAPSKSKDAVYMVRAMVLQATPSGTFYNLSQGAFDDAVRRGSALPGGAPATGPAK